MRGRRLLVTLALASLTWGWAPAAAAQPSARGRSDVLQGRWENATPRERARVRQRARRHQGADSWRGDKQIRRQLHRVLERMTPEERHHLRDYLASLSAAERHDLMKRIRRYRGLPPAEKRELRRRLESFRAMTPEQKQRIRENAERWRDMSPDEKARLRAQMKRLKGMAPEERLELLDRTLPPQGSHEESD